MTRHNVRGWRLQGSRPQGPRPPHYHHQRRRAGIALTLPPTDDLAFLGGVGVLAAAGIIEWPLAGILAVGHLPSRSSRNSAFKAFGEALEEA